MAHTINYVLYQVGWLACIVGAARGHAWVGTTLGLGVVVIHVGLARRRHDEFRLAVWTAAIGLFVDTLLIAIGATRFTAGTVVPWLPPAWLVVVWMQFAMTLRYSLRWLADSAGRAALFGALGGPLAFLIGRRLGVVELHADVWPSLLPLGALWAVAVPAAARLTGRRPAAGGTGQYRWPRSMSPGDAPV